MVFLHRALVDGYPENSLPGIQAACKKGISAIEIDIVATKNNRLIVFHENNMKELLNTGTLAERANYHDVENLTIKNSGVKVPLLTDVIPIIQHCHMIVELDLKNTTHPRVVAAKISKLFKKYNLYHQVFVSSLYPIPLYFIRHIDPKIITAYAVYSHAFHNPRLNQLMIYLSKYWIPNGLGVGLIEPYFDMVSEGYVNFYRERHYYINTWTVNDSLAKQYFSNLLGISYTTDCLGENTSCARWKDPNLVSKKERTLP